MRNAHGFRHGRAVVRNDHEHVDVPADERLDVGHLPRVVTVRGLDEHGGAERRCARDEFVAIPLASGLP